VNHGQRKAPRNSSFGEAREFASCVALRRELGGNTLTVARLRLREDFQQRRKQRLLADVGGCHAQRSVRAT